MLLKATIQNWKSFYMANIGGKEMYFPYVRGRQNELLALRELVENNLLSIHILPVVEPVKLSSTLSKTMEAFIKKEKKLGIVCNPAVGSFNSDMRDDDNSNKQKFLNMLDNEYIIKSHIMKKRSAAQIATWEQKKGVKKSDWIIISNARDCIEEYSDIFSKTAPQFVLIPDEFRRKIRLNKVLFEDRFEKCDRNSDYQKNDDEFFSEDILFYKDEGFLGFGDYSVIGKDYLESGFAPYAVAIHIIYFAEDNSLRVHHFVSDSNDDIQNPAMKFYEAVRKLAKWIEKNDIKPTMGLQAFLEHYKNQTYPGLGSVKKLSLMHHLELVGKYLDEVR